MIRILSALMLALVLALTSQSMAVARGASAATGQMVICTGTGPIAVYVDAEGQPTAAPHLCPDATLHVLTEVDAPECTAPFALARFAQGFAGPAYPAPPLPRAMPAPRGPPAIF